MPHKLSYQIGIVDIGCGNGRNSKFLKEMGYSNVVAFDMADDYGYKMVLGEERFPLLSESADVILANYVLMFLDKKERRNVISEINRIAKPGCNIMMELYPAKDSYAKSKDKMLELQYEIFEMLGDWRKILYSQGRFIARKQW